MPGVRLRRCLSSAESGSRWANSTLALRCGQRSRGQALRMRTRGGAGRGQRRAGAGRGACAGSAAALGPRCPWGSTERGPVRAGAAAARLAQLAGGTGGCARQYGFGQGFIAPPPRVRAAPQAPVLPPQRPFPLPCSASAVGALRECHLIKYSSCFFWWFFKNFFNEIKNFQEQSIH